MLDKHLIVKTYPKAESANILLWRDYRITVLGSRLFRMEKNHAKKFRDDATQSVWFRNMPKQNFTVEISPDKAEIITSDCRLILRQKRSECCIYADGLCKKISNEDNLKGTYRTLDRCDGEKMYADYGENVKSFKKVPLGMGVCSKTGIALFDDANSLTLGQDGEVKPQRGEGTDEYIFAFGRDYRGAVKALYQITGQTPMIPRYALGNWWSRYYEYDENSYLQLLNRFKNRDIPLSVATIDMDWHYSIHIDEQLKITEQGRDTDFYGGKNGWTGYSWNKDLFPDYKCFLKKISDMDLKITLNLHPAEGIRWWEDCYPKMAKAMGMDEKTEQRIPFDIANTKFINNYFSVVHKPYEKDGVSFWWIDWQQGENSKMEGLDPLWSLNHYHYLDHLKNHKNALILSRYAGIGSHRYPLGFSGDTFVSWATLKYLPYFTATATNIGYTWWSHDIGGHMLGEFNGELYVRHLQYGVFSPITRLHSSNAPTMTKEPWAYQNGKGLIAEEWLRLRQSMIPFLYSWDYQTHAYGRALVEPLYYEWGNLSAAYERKNEYLFGGLLVAPITEKAAASGFSKVEAWIPEGHWTDIFTGDEYVSPVGGINTTLLRTLDSIPVLAKGGTILPYSLNKGNGAKNPKELKIEVYNGEGEFTLFEDNSEEGKDGKFFTYFTARQEKGIQKLKIHSEGNEEVVPLDRILHVVFKNISKGKVLIYENGNKVKAQQNIEDFVSVNFAFSSKKTYEIKVEVEQREKLDKLKERMKKILTFTEAVNAAKEKAYARIMQATSLKDYIQAVDDSKEVSAEIRLRLKETILTEEE